MYQQHFFSDANFIYLKIGRYCLPIVVIDQVGKLKKFPITTLWWGLFSRQPDCRKMHFAQGGGGDYTEGGGGAVRFSIGKHILPHVRESRTVLDSGFHTVDSRFQALDSSICQ